MKETTEKLSITNVDVRIGVGFFLCLLLVHFLPDIQALAACTAVIMCSQDTARFSWKSALTRLLGVVIGGMCGSFVVLLDGLFSNAFVFMLLAGAGVVLNLFACKIFKMPNIVARVSCITFALVVLVAQGNFRIKYALLRLLGTFAGALIALILSWLWDRIKRGKKEA